MKFLIIVALGFVPGILTAQKQVLSLPFEFEKKMLASSDYDAYFLDNQSDSVVSLILKDNRKAEYIQLNKNFKVVSKIDLDLNSTIFNEDITAYRGGTTHGHVFNFIYEEKDKKAFSREVTRFQLETVDFSAKSVKHSPLFDIPKSETVVSSFTDNNTYYTITADDKAKELVFYVVGDAGTMKQHRLPVTIPDIAGKNRDKVSEYFNNLRFFKSNEEPDLSSAVSSAKLFSTTGQLTFVINEAGHPVHLLTIQIPGFTLKESFIDLSSFKKDSKEKIYVNSFKKGDQLFSLILNKKSIQVAVHHATTGELMGKQEINEESNFGLFAHYPVSERRMGKKADEKDVDDIKKLIKALDRGSEGIMVTQNEKGQYILTIGTYNLIPMSTGGSGGGYTGGFTPSSMATTPGITNHGATSTMVMRYDPHKYYRPGTPSYTTTNARYYTTTYFKLLLDGTSYKYAKGKVTIPVSEQIKDYLHDVDQKAKATNQFAIGAKQYYGYYDREAKSYVIEEIRIRK
jgi:hypothetical protein